MEDVEGNLHIDITSDDPAFDNGESENASNASDKLEIMNENEPSSSAGQSVATFIEGQSVQLEDGSTAYIYHRLNSDGQYVQSIELDASPASFIHQPTSSVVTQTEPVEETKSRNFRCDHNGCGKVYPSSHHLRVHKRSHTGEKPHKCSWKDCGKSFSTSYALKSHIRVHTGEKPYDCTYAGCNKAFKTAGDLQKHTRTHTGEKPFKCPFEGCGKAFTTSNICKVHIRTHTGERPYKCPFSDCEKTFSTATNYNNHVRIHTGEKPFSCDWPGCGKRFTEYSSYYKHQAVHADRSCRSVYSCFHCGKYYTYSSTLLQHKKTVHNDDSRIQNSERIRSGRKRALNKDEMKTRNQRNSMATDSSGDSKEVASEESSMVLLPMETIGSEVRQTANDQPAQVTAVVTAGCGQQLAILSHDGSSQQFTLALTDHGSTILLPSSDNASSDTSTKSDGQVMIMSMIDKDNSLQRIEASESDASTADSTPINTDIWLHQPQKEEIPTDIEVKEETAKDSDNINIHFESAQNPCEETSASDSIAYLEIGGAKYQLKIVSAENESEDQICAGNAVSDEEAAGEVASSSSESATATNNVKFNEMSFLTSNGTISKGNENCVVQNQEDERLDLAAQSEVKKCDEFSKDRKL